MGKKGKGKPLTFSPKPILNFEFWIHDGTNAIAVTSGGQCQHPGGNFDP
ncbi:MULTISPECIES: hypothetical protein [unclassified Tolypothrix]|nr:MULTISPECIES: hypothetical protein [unclassified Tolypothrix]BAY90272.1 hypothetical protein NIES3275_22840 [Microchaete diplosiphon NIES-3275]EKE98901.1 hypothetical protein FDUTEX481_03533 [Tolypothrix sp. PCC 7601]MBE9083370.1 hypothetical protein [Tolypothrix sp. LEGE 11397]UYD24463.1 hypothetical protein HGR01_23815 [Tolypothrix sp. PCC 7712]UYD33305.1 hypothetical protein HG267_30855 [Tolypothrix sp. PCC 7601]